MRTDILVCVDDRRPHPEAPGEGRSRGAAPDRRAESGPEGGGAGPHAMPDAAPTRGDRVLHVLLLVWGAVMLGIVLVGVVGFLLHFFLLQR